LKINVKHYEIYSSSSVKENLSFRVFHCFHKGGLGDGLIALEVLVITTAEVKEMPPPISIKPLLLP
jgi:hypothetical protein